MSPKELTSESFARYPVEGQKLAVSKIALLRNLPLGFVPFVLKEVIAYDWKFPAERKELEQQFSYLESLPGEEMRRQMAVFAQLRLSPALEASDWVDFPGQFLEQLSAQLWATHQMDAFRAASETYMQTVFAKFPQGVPSIPRLGIAVIGQGVVQKRYALFRKLSREGVYFHQVKAKGGLQSIMKTVNARAEAHTVPYGHWYIDGGETAALAGSAVTCVSYQALAPARAMLTEKMRKVYTSANFSAEALRTLLAQIGPQELGMSASGADAVLDRFAISLLTEGSGTQIFSTTFVQWAAREALRRAQPVTLLARYMPRQREKPMNELLLEVQAKPESDPHGSLIDGDMGAYYTWLNQQRLTGADQSSFLVWFEDHGEAVAVGPAFPRGTEERKSVEIHELLARVS